MPRPPRADAAATNVVVRFSPDELAALDKLAVGRGVDRSALLRALVAEATGKRGRPKGVAGKRKARKP